MPFVKVHIHLVWSTKNHEPLLYSKEVRDKLWQHMRENARKKDIYIDYIGGYTDHCHCLFSLGIDQTLQKVVQLIKGEASFWFNRQPDFSIALRGKKLEWQNDYFAVSVSESMIDKVRNYIKHQEEHHRHKTFQEEYDEFIHKFGVQKSRE
ncbi:IS200/IS605 family transposase [Prolixibacter sp. NT017]|uniref:IS200/IS605 family transposase n=1 Tax=Prolixibacter sp. NT017 TaxID=2652390 RepID=UPI00127DDDBD|nr:IS200/IS605 family transposase [Prolixibacter sp. NT017]GET27453.1 transposase [Prolixibacter sp. NT017]